jgi:hypothetical protein
MIMTQPSWPNDCNILAYCTLIIYLRMYEHLSLYIAGKRAQACLVRQASHTKTALEHTLEGLPIGIAPSASSHHGYRRVPGGPESEPPPVASETESASDSPDSSSASDLEYSPLQIQIGPARHGYIYDRIRGHVYRCHREPDGCRCQPTRCSLWLRREENFSAPPWKWVALVVIGYGALLVSLKTWAA